MNERIRALATLALTALLGATASGPVLAQAWPAAKPIRLIVSYPPGGGADVMARLVAPKLSESIGQQVVVENRAGASGQIAADAVARSAPDGYTLLLDAASFATNPALFAKLPYDPATAFAPVTVLAQFPNMLVVHPPYAPKNVRELVELARAKPGSVSYASSGNGSAQHLAAELFAQRMGLDMVHVPYKGGGPAMTDVMGGQVPVFFANVASGLANVKAGKLRVLGLTGAKRIAALPDTPTLAEAGVPDYEVYEWNAIFAPAATPPEIVAQLSTALQKVMALPELRERVAASGGEVVATSPQQTAAFIRRQTEFWGAVIRKGNIKPD